MDYTDEPEFLMDDEAAPAASPDSDETVAEADATTEDVDYNVEIRRSRVLTKEELLLVLGSTRVSINALMERLRDGSAGSGECEWQA